MPTTRIVPQADALEEATSVLRAGGVVAFPTDTLYGIGCAFDRPRAVERILAMRGIDPARRPLTFLLPDLGMLARYAHLTAEGHRILSRILPGPYCVELLATDAVPPRFASGRRKTIGVRVPDHAFCERLLWTLALPVVSASAKTQDGRALTSARDIAETYPEQVDLVVDGGELDGQPSTVISVVDDWVTVMRRGQGDPDRILGFP
ncbi:MAG TPA: L-threonylcarbamoyladenylate synthase [Polyangia bacterium]|nr:L-threonylcarbamoyladenylate synthase [Polyangia bacterium]